MSYSKNNESVFIVYALLMFPFVFLIFMFAASTLKEIIIEVINQSDTQEVIEKNTFVVE